MVVLLDTDADSGQSTIRTIEIQIEMKQINTSETMSEAGFFGNGLIFRSDFQLPES